MMGRKRWDAEGACPYGDTTGSAEGFCLACYNASLRPLFLIFIVCILAGGIFGFLAGRSNLTPPPSQEDALCLDCHQNIIQQDTLSPKAKGAYDLIFFHSSHVETMKLGCSPCHASTEEAAHQSRPEMTTCLVCHDGTLAGNGCTLCHGPKAKIDIRKDLP